MDAHCRTCAEEISHGTFDLLLVHPCIFFRTSSIARFVNLPTILYLQEPNRGLYEAQPRLPWLKPAPSTLPFFTLGRLRAKALAKRSLANVQALGAAELENAAAFDRILVNSLFSRESILRAYGLDSEVCYLGTDLSRFANLGLTREHYVVGLGSYTAEKNLALAIEAIALLPQPRPELVWVGNVDYGGTWAAMKVLAAARGVVFTAHLGIPDAQLIDILNRASLMIYAPRLEPFGLAPIEAAACGLPIVAVAEGGVRETVIDNETGLLVDNTAQAVAASVGMLLANPGLARRLGENGRATAAQRWSFDAATDRIEQALQRHLEHAAGLARGGG